MVVYMFNDNVEERYELAIDRIKEIKEDCNIEDKGFCCYFSDVAAFIVNIDLLSKKIDGGWLEHADITELKNNNEEIYSDIVSKAYEHSFANPVYAVSKLGLDWGRIASFLYVEIRGMIVYAYEGNKASMVTLMELFIEVFCLFSDGRIPESKEARDVIYWYVSDYSDDFIERRVKENVSAEYSFASDIIEHSDLTDIRYLYRFGEYITDNEIKTAKYLSSLSDEEIEKIAATFTNGYKIGFELTGKDMSKKKTVNIRFNIGFERIVKKEIEQFRKMGLDAAIYRAAVSTINKRMHMKIGYCSTSPNRQMDYDHRFDNALYIDSAYIERKLGALKLAYENNKTQAALFGGPAVMEVFGENPFEPVNHEECFSLDDKQRKLLLKYDSEAGEIVNTYIKGEERSYTIMALPAPEIGPDFEQIFAETVKINTLDYEKNKVIQQNIIDAMDGCEYVEIKGTNGNLTDIRVNLMNITDKEKQTVFENCLADVNIPLGEVFTSPVLKGTTGTLNVSSVYLNDIKFKNLTVQFKDGFVTDYSCDNFDDKEKGRELFKENVLYNRETLPIGEFAIGTNTTAYVMANKYDIVYKLPILIVEKMGPHFAVGDTCYSRTEDIKVYNPNGKEIISRDNEISLKRNDKPDEAYYNCHTDITIPYDEIGSITAVGYDGSENVIIKDGRFVLKGTEILNEPFALK